MPEGTFLPPWLTRDYDPVGAFLHAFQTGAQISEEQTRLAEQQRQANMEAQARSEQLQANMLRAMTETAVQKEYQQQQIGLRQQELAQEKQRYDALGQDAAARIAETMRHNQMMEALRQTQLEGDVEPELMEKGGKQFLVNRKTGHFQELRDPNRAFQQGVARMEAGNVLKQLNTARAKQNEEGVSASERERLQKQIDALSAQYGATIGPWTNAPAPMVPGPQSAVPTSSGNEVVRRTKDGKLAVFDSITKKFLRYAD